VRRDGNAIRHNVGRNDHHHQGEDHHALDHYHPPLKFAPLHSDVGYSLAAESDAAHNGIRRRIYRVRIWGS
jgi:hypothetical protein